MGYQEAANYIVWLNEQDRIASFHFMAFLQSLQERGYRFR